MQTRVEKLTTWIDCQSNDANFQRLGKARFFSIQTMEKTVSAIRKEEHSLEQNECRLKYSHGHSAGNNGDVAGL